MKLKTDELLFNPIIKGNITMVKETIEKLISETTDLKEQIDSCKTHLHHGSPVDVSFDEIIELNTIEELQSAIDLLEFAKEQSFGKQLHYFRIVKFGIQAYFNTHFEYFKFKIKINNKGEIKRRNNRITFN